MEKPFGIEYLEPIGSSDEVMGNACAEQQTFHLKSGTVTQELVCDD